MLPIHLTAAQFGSYPPQARELALAHLPLLRAMPVVFLPSFLRELIEYDYKFPAERAELEGQLRCLTALTPAQFAEWFAPFARLRLSAAEEAMDWVGQPLPFTEQLSAYLWSTGQMDAFRDAATAYGNRLHAALAPEPPPMRRLGIAIIGQGATVPSKPLFGNLRRHGTYFSRVDPTDGVPQLLASVEARARRSPVAYGHWYVDGGAAAAHSDRLTCISYGELGPVRDALLGRIQTEVAKPGMGPEQLRDFLARLSPGDVGMRGDAVLDRFRLRLLTEGSGTQIFSTTFAQWTARELLRRAAALSLLVRFAPRQRQRPMNELLASSKGAVALDPDGSLVDADMAAYYQWINQQRLPGSEHSAFVVWFEGHREAVAIGPTLAPGVESTAAVGLEGLVSLATA